MELIKKTFAVFWELIESVTFAFGFFMVTYLFLFQTGQVHGASSYPTLKENDMFITDKISYKIGKPQRGDFVVLQSPGNKDIDFIKRIIGLPGETLKISEGLVYINNNILEESYLVPGTKTTGNLILTIPNNYYYVMGDNRSNSSDSRVFGPIPETTILGKVVLRFWPPDKVGKIL